MLVRVLNSFCCENNYLGDTEKQLLLCSYQNLTATSVNIKLTTFLESAQVQEDGCDIYGLCF